jgi:hypothetical protein
MKTETEQQEDEIASAATPCSAGGISLDEPRSGSERHPESEPTKADPWPIHQDYRNASHIAHIPRSIYELADAVDRLCGILEKHQIGMQGRGDSSDESC